MTENELKAIKWMKCVKDDAIVTLDHIARNEPNVSPMLYAGRKEKAETIINGFEELEQYRAIGTVEECREARERQRGKKPILCMNEVSGMFVDYADGHGEYKTQMNNWWRCPCCNEVVGQRVIVHKRIHDQRKKKFCEKCGQAIDWSDAP